MTVHSAHRIGYARVSELDADRARQLRALSGLGVPAHRVYLDVGLVGARRRRPALDAALEACGAGDTLVVTRLHRLARSLRDACTILDELDRRRARLAVGGLLADPADPGGALLRQTLAVVADFETELVRTRTREGMRAAAARGRLRGRRPKLSAAQRDHLVRLHQRGGHTVPQLAAMFGVARSTVYRVLARHRSTSGAGAITRAG